MTVTVGDVAFTYFVVISIGTFLAFGFDKLKARRGWWRVPEKTLLMLCFFGGSIGGGLGMMVFHHKVSKAAFMRAYWVIVFLQIVAAAGLVYCWSRGLLDIT